MNTTSHFTLLWLLLVSAFAGQAQTASTTGAQLWFAHQRLHPASVALAPATVFLPTDASPALRHELQQGLQALFGQVPKPTKKPNASTLPLLLHGSREAASYLLPAQLERLALLGPEGYCLLPRPGQQPLLAANTPQGLLYAVFHYLRSLQTEAQLSEQWQRPAYQRRILNHWDNLDGTVERGYAGHSIWQWHLLPDSIPPQYLAYARANAAIGINGTVLNNVNATPQVLSPEQLAKTRAVADALRPYGLRVYLAVNFSSPKALGGLPDSDPLRPEVQQWWAAKAKEIYALIPDFGGFLVKANSEGLPGPQDYGRTHADGANMLADALRPHGGIVMWRAFVYQSNGADRARQAYDEFMPLDGKFRSNVMVQVKNGPIDFQPREPFSPLFGAMQHTTLMPEWQLTQEYLGFSTHLVYLAPLFKEFLEADTHAKGRHSTVAAVTDGRTWGDSITAIAGVANIGLDANWCGHHFAQANWYAFGRLAWNHSLSADELAREWLVQTFGHALADSPVRHLMLESREAAVNYMTPLGLHHLMGWDHHHGPEPWCVVPGARPDWLPSYYHRADSVGIGFDRSSLGSNAVAQYAEPLRSTLDHPQLCPSEWLLWFHHLPWDYTLRNGRSLWNELCYRYYTGAEQAQGFVQLWEQQRALVDAQRFDEVAAKLRTQAEEAIWWRDACVLYFQRFSQRPIPPDLPAPTHQLPELMKRKFDLKHHN